jgi:cell division protein FtsI/penicillin-binding protein 2
LVFAVVAARPFFNTQSPKPQSDYLFAAPCTRALTQSAVCEAANQHALGYMKTNNLTAVTVVQNVHTGALVAFAASDPAHLDATSALLPLSVIKLFIAASWWQHKNANEFVATDGSRVSVHEMIVSGSDNAGRFTAIELRNTVGAEVIIKELERFGFLPQASLERLPRDEKFWGELNAAWRDRLTPSASYHELNRSISDAEWAENLSIGEAGFRVSALSISRFLQAVGNGGVMLPPAARSEMFTINRPTDQTRTRGERVMPESAALKLQAAMRDVVQRGTAKGIASALYDTGWSIGGKTGSSGPVGPQSDGWFAGLIFDTKRKPRFTVATFVRHGGTGGGNAAKLSADLARFLITSVND